MDSFIKKMNMIPLFHISDEEIIHEPYLATLFDQFHTTYQDLDTDVIEYTMEKDKAKSVRRIRDDLKEVPVVIKEWCMRHFLYDFCVHYIIKGINVRIVFSLFSGYEHMIDTYRSYVPWILHWSSIGYQYSEKRCASPMHIHLYLTPFKKLLPARNIVLDEVHVNTAYTWNCKPSNKIVIYRLEEWFKVLIHESFHFFGFEDFKSTDDHLLKRCFPLDVPLYIGEAYGEFWARTITCFYCAYFIEKERSRKNATLNHFYRFMYIERVFSSYQAVKILKHNNIRYEDFYGESKDAAERRKGYKENTNIFCYYILTAVLMNEYSKMMSWCYLHNKKFFNMEIKHSHLFIDFIKKICKTSKLQHNLSVLGDIPMHDKTLRMTLIDFL